jgi:hypothetical protein
MSANVLTRPRRSILNKKFEITDEVKKILDQESEESDEDFVPNKSSSTAKDEIESSEENTDEAKSDEQQNKEPIEAPKKRKTKKVKKKSVKNKKVFETEENDNKILEKLISKVKPKKVAQNTSEYVGPVVKIDSKKSKDDCLVYTVNNSRLRETGTNEEIAEIKLQKEKLADLKNPEGPWVCTLCHNRPNDNYLGDLYGPYSSELCGEIWIHEGCIVWSEGTYVKNNQLYGLEELLKIAHETHCKKCKKNGASLKCSETECTRTYHYGCALEKSKNFFNLNL